MIFQKRSRHALLLPASSTKEPIVMKSHLAWCLLLAAVASYPVAAGGADQAPKRVKRTCPQMRDDIERASKSMKLAAPIKITPGSWGDVPAPLRKLPKDGENCGIGNQGQVIIVSAANGKELESHYAPLFAEVGCKPLKCSVTHMTNCSCTGPGGAVGVVLSDVGAETYTLMYTRPKK
jgi:hypothetical protein